MVLSSSPRVERKHVFAHSMWRTSSTALARCFLEHDDYLVFYEPFHESCGRIVDIDGEKALRRRAKEKIGHPDWVGDYFAPYKLVDPKTQKPLYELYVESCAVRDVYANLSPATHNYIAACLRIAESKGKAAFLGFCRSGLQQKDLVVEEDTTAFYLVRDPVSQFMSYNFPRNGYFLANTLRQLRHSQLLRPALRATLSRHAARFAISAIDSPILTVRGQFDLLNRICRYISKDDQYAMFALSHQVTRRMARALGTPEVSVDDLSREGEARQAFEAQFGVSVSALRSNVRTLAVSEQQRYARIDARVSHLLNDIDFDDLAVAK